MAGGRDMAPTEGLVLPLDPGLDDEYRPKDTAVTWTTLPRSRRDPTAGCVVRMTTMKRFPGTLNDKASYTGTYSTYKTAQQLFLLKISYDRHVQR